MHRGCVGQADDRSADADRSNSARRQATRLVAPTRSSRRRRFPRSRAPAVRLPEQHCPHPFRLSVWRGSSP
ncbi:hypothetical protein ACFPRL_01435 [Pseudoclavibacter helvolus]